MYYVSEFTSEFQKVLRPLATFEYPEDAERWVDLLRTIAEDQGSDRKFGVVGPR